MNSPVPAVPLAAAAACAPPPPPAPDVLGSKAALPPPPHALIRMVLQYKADRRPLLQKPRGP